MNLVCVLSLLISLRIFTMPSALLMSNATVIVVLFVIKVCYNGVVCVVLYSVSGVVNLTVLCSDVWNVVCDVLLHSLF